MTQTQTIRFPAPELDTLPDDVRSRIEEVFDKAGFIPNVFAILARRPAEFRAFFDYHDALMEREECDLTRAEREMIVVATSAANQCEYCVIAHGALVRIYAKRPLLADQIAVNYRTADLSDRERRILDFAVKVAVDSAAVSGQDFAALHAVGLDDEAIWDIGSISAFFGMSNRIASVTGMRANEEFYLLGRLPHDKRG
jgi:uncharacterized peroxidase-related enzyme